MSNEVLFFTHILLVVGFTCGALRLGKGALSTLIALQTVLANLFVVKQMSLFGFSVTCSDVFAVGAILGLNLLQEYHGRDEANRVVRISFFALLFFIAMSQIHLLYAPLSSDTTHAAFSTILSQTPRIALASVAVYYVVQKLDVRLFGWLKNRLPKVSLSVRIGISLFLTQFLDTVLFSVFGLWGLVSSLFDIIVLSFLVKCCIIACSAPLTSFSRRFVKHVPL